MLISLTDIKPGAVFEVVHPFCAGIDRIFNSKTGEYENKTNWRPGIIREFDEELDIPEYGNSTANGEGKQVLTVVDVHKPGEYQTRVFYTRYWIDPDGTKFGKPHLRMMGIYGFKRLISEYRHKYRIEEVA